MDIAPVPTPNDPTPFTPAAQADADKALLVKFFTKPKEDREASAAQGRPVFIDVDYVDIKVPGSNTGVCRPATHADRLRFPDHYRAFQERQEMPEVGTPLAQWPPISRSMVEQLAFFNVKTVEQLAEVPDSALPKVMGFQRFKQLAKDFLSAAKADAPLAALRAEIEERDLQLSAQARTIEALTTRLDALEAAARGEAVGAAPSPLGEAVVAASEPEPPISGYTTVLDAGGEDMQEEAPPLVPAPEPEQDAATDAENPPASEPPRRRRRPTA